MSALSNKELSDAGDSRGCVCQAVDSESSQVFSIIGRLRRILQLVINWQTLLRCQSGVTVRLSFGQATPSEAGAFAVNFLNHASFQVYRSALQKSHGCSIFEYGKILHKQGH